MWKNNYVKNLVCSVFNLQNAIIFAIGKKKFSYLYK